MTLMYSSKNGNDDSHNKTNTSRARYSRNNSSDNDNIHTDCYKQGTQQPDVAPREMRGKSKCTQKKGFVIWKMMLKIRGGE
jgi:hypothetical protein